MKKFLISLIATLPALAFAAGAYAQTGDWSGKLSIGDQSLTIVFHFNGDDCTMDSPDQGAKGIKGTLERNATGVKVYVPSINMSYEGMFLGNMITGTFTQNGFSLPLTLTPGAPRLNRPQTPKEPFPYTCEEVSFSNGSATLKGTLTLPEGCTEDTPVLVMVTGSGLQNRDEELFEHKPFAVIADALAREGFATLRYDDRGFGESTGDLVSMTTRDLANDALAGIELMRGRFKKVGILGHSEGGSIAFMLAAEKKTDFVVSLAGAIVSGKQTLMEQNRLALANDGYSEEVNDIYCRALEKIFDASVQGLPVKVPDSEVLPQELENNLNAVAGLCSSPYMRYFLALDVSTLLKDVSCPVLALNGTLDSQVLAGENLGLLQEGLTGVRNKAVVPVEGLNHMFQHCTTGLANEYKEIEETFAPEVLDTIISWLKTL